MGINVVGASGASLNPLEYAVLRAMRPYVLSGTKRMEYYLFLKKNETEYSEKMNVWYRVHNLRKQNKMCFPFYTDTGL